MKPIFVKNSILAKMIRVEAIVIYPFVFFASKNPSATLIRHESVHLDQVQRLGFCAFYFHYMKEYFFNRVRRMNHYDAYRAISFEREAYEKENKSADG